MPRSLTCSLLLIIISSYKKSSLLWAGASEWRIYYHRMWSQLSTIWKKCYWSSQLGDPRCSRPQPAMDDGTRDGRSNWLAATPHRKQGSTPWAPRIVRCTVQMLARNNKTCCSYWDANAWPSECQANALHVRSLRVYNNVKAVEVLFHCF